MKYLLAAVVIILNWYVSSFNVNNSGHFTNTIVIEVWGYILEIILASNITSEDSLGKSQKL